MGLHPNAAPGDPLADPRNLTYLVWRRLGLPDPTPIQYEVVDFLAFGPYPTRSRESSPNNYLIAQAFRGMGKSWLASVLTLWELRHNPGVNVMVLSATAQRSNDFSRFCHRLIHEIPELSAMRPRPGQRDSSIAWDVGNAPAAHAPSCRSLGIGGQLTGSRADLIIPDDTEILTNSATEEQRAKIRAAFAEFSSILKPNGRVVGLGTPQSEMTIYKDLEQRGYYIRRWPSRVPTQDELRALGAETVSESIVARSEAGEAGQPTEPSRFPTALLEEREAVIGRSTFAVQFQLDTSLADGLLYPLRLSDIAVGDFGPETGPGTVIRSTRPVQDLSVCGLGRDKPVEVARVDDWARYDRTITAVDPAGRGTDETVAMNLSTLGGNIFLTGMYTTQGEGYSDAALEAICRLAARGRSDTYLVESNFGDGAFTRLLEGKARKLHRAGVEEVRHHTQKEARIIDSLEPPLNQGRIFVSRQVLEQDARPAVGGEFGEDVVRRLTYQLARMTRQKGALAHDDRVDCLSMGVRYLVDFLRLASDEERQRREDAAQEEEIRRFIAAADGLDYDAQASRRGWGARRP